MRQYLTRVTTGLHLAAFTVLCLAGAPIILFHFGVSAVRDRIEARWPESAGARAVSFWLGLLAPVVLLVVVTVVLGFAIAHVRALKHSERSTAPDLEDTIGPGVHSSP